MKRIIAIFLSLGLALSAVAKDHEGITSFTKNAEGFALAIDGVPVPIIVEPQTDKGVARAAADLATDFERVTGRAAQIVQTPAGKRVIFVGVVGQSVLIDKHFKKQLQGKVEKYLITTLKAPFEGVDEALVIAGSDKRGAIYGLYELSEQIGVSPWHYWADVPAEKHADIVIRRGEYTAGEPAVRYRGIFLNDEAPALTGWVRENFGGYNSKFYVHVFELILRLRGNFLWPAMWDAAFYDDDPLNSPLAQEYGIVMGTSHHEPMARAHKEWTRYGTGPWNYEQNEQVLKQFWREGVERMQHTEDLVTIAMRGDGDEPMSEQSNIALLERIVADQRRIIADVTGKKASATPQVWALYKEVQEYYDRGMRVPDDVTLLLCDDNWGNIRKLPELDAKPRTGGYGMYYHFDYVGAPRNYKWLNVTPVQKTWEQMSLCAEWGVDRIWVVNVGDLKPMEYPITFFLDMAWNPARFNPDNLFAHTESWCEQTFGGHAPNAARLIDLYTKYNRRRTPELLDWTTYSLENYDEFARVCEEYRQLALEAENEFVTLPAAYRDAYEQLVRFPIVACSNLYDLYYAVARNRALAAKGDVACNEWADRAEAHYLRDSLLTIHYNKEIAGGKWNHMMDQTHIGYTYWQQPNFQVMPPVTRLAPSSSRVYAERDGAVAIESAHYARKSDDPKARWVEIPGLSRTLSGMTLRPSNVVLGGDAWLEYDLDLRSSCDTARVILVFCPTLNFNANRGLRYAISIDGGEEQIVNLNGHYRGELGQWQGEGVIESTTRHALTPGRHALRIRNLDTGLVLQKIMVDMGGMKPSLLGPPEK